MMQIGNVNAAGTSVQAQNEQVRVTEDSASKEIQGKITDAQKRRQELSSNVEMTAEEKADRRQKIQQEISDLKRELRRRQLEEQKKQQEEEKAAKAKKEQKENASKEAVKEQQRSQSTQSAGGRQQESKSGSQNSRNVEGSKEEENRDVLPGVMHKSLSTETTVNQISILANTTARADGRARVREAEIDQDAARGADAAELKKAQRAEFEKDARRMERIQAFMFGGSSKAAESDLGVVKQTFGGVRGKGLYNNDGMMFKTNFQSVQMDLKQ